MQVHVKQGQVVTIVTGVEHIIILSRLPVIHQSADS